MQLPKLKGFADAIELLQHFADHGSDFAAPTMSKYEAMADHFLSKPKTPDMQECRRLGGDLVRFDRITSEFGVVSATGIIRTYFIPKPCPRPRTGPRRTDCHNFPTNLDYAHSTCNQGWR